MTNNHGDGKRLICDNCYKASRTFDKSLSFSFVRTTLKAEGWSVYDYKKKDQCPACSQARKGDDGQEKAT